MRIRAEHKHTGQVIIATVRSIKEFAYLNPSFWNVEAIGK